VGAAAAAQCALHDSLLDHPSELDMKEILYIQAGSLANHIGTHFWNTQESYFTYDAVDANEDVAEPEVEHDRSFLEGETRQVCVLLLVCMSAEWKNEPALGRSDVLSQGLDL
jgi:hypothetical protein